VLQVGVHGYDHVAARVLQAGEQRGLMPEVPGEADPADPRVLPTQLGEDGARSISIAVVHHNDLVVIREWAEDRTDFLGKLRKSVLFVVRGCNYRQQARPASTTESILRRRGHVVSGGREISLRMIESTARGRQ
jgi:hypothetical protein